MIEVRVAYRSGRFSSYPHELALMRITRLDKGDTETGDYVVQLGVERGKSYGLHRRRLKGFPRKKGNVLALLKLALEEFLDDEEVFSLDDEIPSTLARRRRRTLPEISKWES